MSPPRILIPWLSLCAIACGDAASGDTGELGPDACVEVLSFRDQSELCDIAPLPDGYVLNAFQKVVAYELDDTPRFEIPGDFEGFGTTDDGQIVTIRRDAGALVGEAWSAAGEALGEVARIEEPGVGLDPHGVVVLVDGRIAAWGGGWRDEWEATSGQGVVRPESVSIDDQRLAPDGRRWVLSTRYTNDDGRFWTQDLSLRDATGQTQWSVPVNVVDGETSPSRRAQLIASVGDTVYVSITGRGGGEAGPIEVHRYDATGTLVWSETQTYESWGGPGLPHALSDGSVAWVDRVDDDLRIRIFDDADTVACEQQFVGNDRGYGLAELALVDDMLLVVTIDRITNLRLLPRDG